MPIDEIYDRLSDLSNYKEAGGVFAGFFLSDAVMPTVIRGTANAVGAGKQVKKVPDEVYGLITVLVGYTISSYTDMEGVGNAVALGGLVSVLDHVTERFNLKSRTKNALNDN